MENFLENFYKKNVLNNYVKDLQKIRKNSEKIHKNLILYDSKKNILKLIYDLRANCFAVIG